MRQKMTNSLGRRAGQALVLGMAVGALTACDGLLEADIPHLLTDEALAGAGTAGTQVASIQGLYECGASTFGWVALGHEDVYESVAGVAGSAHIYRESPVGGTCDVAGATQAWFDQIMGARALNSNSLGTGVYDKIASGEFSLGSEGGRLQAIGAIYHAASMLHFGQFFCEGAIDGSAPMSDADFLADALTWIDRVPGHIGTAGGDFGMPNGASTSAATMASAIRAQILFAQGNVSGAAAEATGVPDGYAAYITRESGEQRRNKYNSAAGFSGILGVNNFWNPASRVNPATGVDYPNPIPHTGYIFLGFGPDGETIDAGTGLPITWAAETRDASENPVPNAGFSAADADTRVAHAFEAIQGPEKREVVRLYNADDEDIPMATWIEMRLLRALNAAESGNGAGVVTHINAIRTHASVNVRAIQGAHLADLNAETDVQRLRGIVFEEARRSLFAAAGRFHAWKINNTDLAYFPRSQGSTPFQGYQLGGGVRFHFPNDEYELNANFEPLGQLDARGTLCASDEAPVLA